MTILHILASGGIGGIETLCKDYATFSRNKNIVLVLWGAGCIAEEMRDQGIVVINLNSSKRDFFGMMKSVIAICKQENVETIVVHHAAPMAHILLMSIKNKYPDIRTVAYAHANAADMGRSRPKKGLWLRRYVLATSITRADKVVAISQSVKKSLISCFFIPEEKINVIYNGINTSKFLPNEKKKISRPLELIYVGRLIEEKGVQVTLKGLANLSGKLDYHFKIVGDGEYRNELEQFARELDIMDKIDFLGSRRDIAELLRGSDVFVHMPVWEEGFGITIIEAMAAGLICVCADAGAIPEIIDDCKNGFLVEAGNGERLSENIKKIQSLSDDVYMEIKRAARAKTEKFTIEKFAERLDSLIEDL